MGGGGFLGTGIGGEKGLLGTGLLGSAQKMKGFNMDPALALKEKAMLDRQESIAKGQTKDPMGQQMAQQAAASTAASARGIANPMLAQRAAQQTLADQAVQQQANQQAMRQQAEQMIAAQAASQRGVALQQAQSNLQSEQATRAANTQAIAGLGQSAMMASDKNLKENIKPASDDLQKFAEALKGYNFNYKDQKDGAGPQTGVMAQDLEKSKVGSQAVIDTPEGKMVDYAKLMPAMLATIAEQEKRIKKMEG